MSKAEFVVENEQLEKMFYSLTNEERNKAASSAASSAALILRKKTIENFASGTNFKAVNIYKRNGKEKRLKLVRVKKLDRKLGVVVDILSDFRAKFFEKGTVQRKTKGRRKIYKAGFVSVHKIITKPANRGSITARWYFKSAQESEERRCYDAMREKFVKYIKKIASKKL